MPSPLRAADLGRCQDLSKEAGWNQNEADWRFVLEAGVSFGLRRDANVVATAGIIPYGPFGWICMVLVTAAERRQGFASRLMRDCMEWLERRGEIAGLDATPDGRAVYRQLGFADIYGITRFAGEGGNDGPASDAIALAPLQEPDLARISDYDRPRFGGERMPLLSRWRARAPALAHAGWNGDRLRGYGLGRDGLAASHVGPVVADDESIAMALIAAAISRCHGRVLIDVPDRHRSIQQWLERCGFVRQRTFTRMLCGRTMPLDQPEHIFALAGAEFG